MKLEVGGGDGGGGALSWGVRLAAGFDGESGAHFHRTGRTRSCCKLHGLSGQKGKSRCLLQRKAFPLWQEPQAVCAPTDNWHCSLNDKKPAPSVVLCVFAQKVEKPPSPSDRNLNWHINKYVLHSCQFSVLFMGIFEDYQEITSVIEDWKQNIYASPSLLFPFVPLRRHR